MGIRREDLLNRGGEILASIYDNVSQKPQIKLKELESNKTALIIVDMINGFAREGALSSNRIEGIIEPIVKLVKACEENGIQRLAFADCHDENSIEFDSYPRHCLKGTRESEVVEEIHKAGSFRLIPKNSTNGFLEEEFQKWIKSNNKIDSFIVVGDCTDICIMQFALTLKTYFNTRNEKSRIIVPVNAVETYDLGNHNGDIMNIMALQIMEWNGIELVSNIEI